MGTSTRSPGAFETLGLQPRLVHAPRIVVAEDDPEMRRLIATALYEDGYEVTEVPDGGKLLVQIVSRQPDLGVDLVIADVRMPVSSGLQILKGLRDAGWRMPFILLSAFGNQETRAEAELLGAIFFEKPLELESLRGAVHRLVPAVRARG